MTSKDKKLHFNRWYTNKTSSKKTHMRLKECPYNMGLSHIGVKLKQLGQWWNEPDGQIRHKNVEHCPTVRSRKAEPLLQQFFSGPTSKGSDEQWEKNFWSSGSALWVLTVGQCSTFSCLIHLSGSFHHWPSCLSLTPMWERPSLYGLSMNLIWAFLELVLLVYYRLKCNFLSLEVIWFNFSDKHLGFLSFSR